MRVQPQKMSGAVWEKEGEKEGSQEAHRQEESYHEEEKGCKEEGQEKESRKEEGYQEEGRQKEKEESRQETKTVASRGLDSLGCRARTSSVTFSPISPPLRFLHSRQFASPRYRPPLV